MGRREDSMRFVKISLAAFCAGLALGTLQASAAESRVEEQFLPGLAVIESADAVKIDVRCKNGDCFRFGWEAYDHSSGITAKFTCIGNDCRTKGWNERASILAAKATCKAGGCYVGGWTEKQTPFGSYRNDATCRKRDCWKYGWDSVGSRGSLKVACDAGGCAKVGATVTLANGSTARMRCTSGDCLHVGYTISQ
jgi:hypothetical protein